MGCSFLLFYLLLCCICLQAKGAIVTTVSNGFWSDSAVWSTATVPDSTDSIYVKHSLLLDGDITVSLPGYLFVDTTGRICGHHDMKIGVGVTLMNRGVIRIRLLDLYGDYADADAGFLNSNMLILNGVFHAKGCGYSGFEVDCNATLRILPTEQRFCKEDCIQFTLTGPELIPVTAPQRQWFFEGGTPAYSSDTTPNVFYDSAGVFSIMLVTSFGCRVWDTVYHEITITETGTIIDTAICEGDTVMVGNVMHTSAGTFFDFLTTESGCDSAVMTTITLLPSQVCNVGIDENLFPDVDLYPNPFTDELFIRFTEPQQAIATIEIFNTLGRLVYSSSEISNAPHTKKVETQTAGAGIYFIKLCRDAKCAFYKVMKEG